MIALETCNASVEQQIEGENPVLVLLPILGEMWQIS